MQPQFPFERLDLNLQFFIMKKMRAVELCRMRRTNSIVDDFVERNRKQFSSCTKLGVKISITTKKDTTTVKIRDGAKIRKTVNLLSLDFDRQFSGVAIKKFKIELSEERSYEMSWKLFHIMQKFRPVCENLNIRHFENDILCKMLEFITVRETAMIVPKDHMNNNQLFDKYIAKLSKMQMSHKMSIHGTFISDVDGLFEKVKYFGEFGFHVQDVEMFRTFFYDMYESSNLGNLKRICCNFVYWKNDIESPISFKNTPPLTVLWNLETFPEEKKSHLMILFALPVSVRKLDIGNKSVLLIENKNHYSNKAVIVVVEKSQKEVVKVLLDVLRLTKVTENDVDKMVNADWNELPMLITEALLKRLEEPLFLFLLKP